MLAYQPETLPPSHIDWQELIPLLGRGNRAIARYDGLLQSIPNPHILLAPLKTREAVLSSRIEGTQATLEEVLAYEAKPDMASEHVHDIQEVINYREALRFAVEQLHARPLSLNLIRKMHHLLMGGVRGQHADRGTFRRVQNWIGKPGSTLENARFVPPSVPDMHSSLDQWEKYIHREGEEYLVQLALIHAQFEIIHPFLDGNGRIGRILIPLFLYEKRVIHEPVFYMSAFLERHRQQYYDALKAITDAQQWTSWIRFFLNGMIRQAQADTAKIKAIQSSYEDMKSRLVDLTHSQFSIQALDTLFSRPYFSSAQFLEESNIPKASANRILKSLSEAGLIQQVEKSSGRKPAVYLFEPLLKIVTRDFDDFPDAEPPGTLYITGSEDTPGL